MKFVKVTVISVLIISISSLHMQTTAAEHGLHILHQQLFFIPIILTGFWFGLRIGLVVAMVVCVIYAPLVISHSGHHAPTTYPVLFTQLAMYLFVSILVGWLSDRRLTQQIELLEGARATALAKAASTLSLEIKNVVNSLNQIHNRAFGLKNPNEEKNFQLEIDRLNHLVEVLVQYVPKDKQSALSTDLNVLLESSYKTYCPQAKKAGVYFDIQMDALGCPSMIISESLSRVLDALVENGLEASNKGQKVTLSSKRGGSACYLDVSDEGEGVAAENLEKLFTPFFTTKSGGSGLSLSAGRKVLRDQGGDLVHIPKPSGGSIFRIIVPRENINQNIDEFVREQKVASEKI